MKVTKRAWTFPPWWWLVKPNWGQQRDLNWTELNWSELCLSLTQDWAALCSLALNKTGNAACCLTSHPWRGSWQRHCGIYLECFLSLTWLNCSCWMWNKSLSSKFKAAANWNSNIRFLSLFTLCSGFILLHCLANIFKCIISCISNYNSILFYH